MHARLPGYRGQRRVEARAVEGCLLYRGPLRAVAECGEMCEGGAARVPGCMRGGEAGSIGYAREVGRGGTVPLCARVA